jgi:integrase
MPQTTRKQKRSKPGRPYPDFPLFPHQNGQWAKKIRGRLHYFGLLADPDAALGKYQQQRDDLHAGRTPRTTADGLTVRDLVNRFLTAKQQLVDSGELAPRSFADYHATGARVVAAFGRDRLVIDLAADDFESLRSTVAKSWGPVALGNEITRVRVLFKYAYDAGLIDRPVRYGPQFKRPSKKVLRKARHEKGPRMFSAADVKALLKAATRPMKAMILLGVNAGFGNADLGTLPLSAIDLKGRWVNYPRPKTEIHRRVSLWSETAQALKEAIATRPTPKNPDDDHLVFLTKYGLRWAKDTRDNPISKEFAKLLD